MQIREHSPARTALSALATDVACVIVFCAVGRRTHAEGLTIGGIAATAWPFLAGTLLGWLSSRGWRRPTAIVPTGLAVWLCTVLVAMLLRRTTSQGTATSFVAVATLVTAALILGWRAAARLIRGLRSRRS